MSEIAHSYVYRNLDTGQGYVGRSPRGNFELIARRGQAIDAETIAVLGLSDLEDHTDYEAVLAEAEAAGAPVTAKRADGSIGVKVGGRWAKEES